MRRRAWTVRPERAARPSLLLLLVLPVLLGSVTTLSAVATAATVFTAPNFAYAQSADLDRQAREIASDLRCPVCQNLSVADSPSALATEMRAIIRQKLEAGESRQAIMQYFVERYGESVLLNPPQQGFTLLVWLGAAAAVVGGAGLLALRLRNALAPGGRHSTAARSSRDDNKSPSVVPPEDGGSRGAPTPGLPRDRMTEIDPYEAALDAQLEQYKQGAGL